MSNAVYMYVPFEKIERKDGECWVEGYAFVNEVVPGEDGIRLRRDAMEAASADYMKFGALREMHGRVAAGTVPTLNWEKRGAKIRAKVVDPIARLKVEEGVYKGFSVGVQPTVMRGKDIYNCSWFETSLVDRPKDPDALFTTRAEGTVIDRAEAVDPVIHAALAGLGLPAEVLRGHGHECACTGCELERSKPRVTCPDCKFDKNTPTDTDCKGCGNMLAENAKRCGGDMEHVAEGTETRAIDSETAPSRENLEGRPKDLLDAAKRTRSKKAGADHKKDGVVCEACGHNACDCQECKDEIASRTKKPQERLEVNLDVTGVEAVVERLNALSALFDANTEKFTIERATWVTRAETAETRLAEVEADLTAAREQLTRISGEARPVANPVRFPGALTREFLVNRGNESKELLTRLQTEYANLVDEAVPHGLSVDEQQQRAIQINTLKQVIARMS